jgi:hypothetical protein
MYIPSSMSFAKQWSSEKRVEHYVLIDWRNSLGTLRWHLGPVVLEMMPRGPQARPLGTGEHWAHKKIADAGDAQRRFRAWQRSGERWRYDALSNNCEHWARYIAFGEPLSEQVRGWTAVAGIVCILWLMNSKAA